jgi:nucleotide-binding universal stress UspA family protein
MMFDHILVPLDGSLLAERVLPHVLSIAQATKAQVTLMHVLDRGTALDRMEAVDPWTWNFRKVEATSYLHKICTRLQHAGLQLATVLDEGPAADQILKFAHKHQVSLIALSSHGQSGLSSWNISSVVQKVLLRAYTSLLIVPAYRPLQETVPWVQYKHICVPLDCSVRAEYALPIAVQLASLHRGSLLLVHVISRPGMPSHLPLSNQEVDLVKRVVERNQREAEDYLKRILTRLSSEDYAIQTCVQVSQNPIETLHDLVEGAGPDLLILCAHGNTGGCRWPYGSVTLNFIAYGTFPLLILQDLSTGPSSSTLAELAVKEHAGH